MRQPAGIPSHFHGTFHLGRVSSVNKDNHTVQVEHFEIDGWVSGDLQVLATRPGDYSLPAPGTPVACVVFDGDAGTGLVLGCFYTESDGPPLSDDGARSVAGDDVRLGDPAASDAVAIGPKVKSELDKIRDEFESIGTTLGSLTGQASFGTAYMPSYTASDPSAEKVKAK